MNRFISIFFYASLLFFSGSSLANAAFDSSKPLVCAIVEVFDCDVQFECDRVNANSVNLPDIFRMDIQKKEMSGADRSTKIQHLTHEEGRVILHGTSENGRGWSVSLSESTGKFTGAVAADEFGLLIFGSCIAD